MKVKWLTWLVVGGLAIAACTSAPTTTSEPPTLAPAPSTPTEAAPPATPTPEDSAPREVTFQTEDGITLGGTLFGQGTVGVVLLHMLPTNQTSWHDFAEILAENGYMALAFDFRGYGKSDGTRQIAQMDGDVRAASGFLKEQGAQQIVLIGASMGGTVSAKAAAAVGADGLVVLSSPMRIGSLNVTEDDVKSFQGASLWVVSEGDRDFVPDINRMHTLANEPKTLHVYEGSAHGTDIFGTARAEELRQEILDFLSSLGG
ncbi:MAG TPA: alpha/beta fold hydrolase [Anaerolineae bacterium]|nr:alpha/beta fold hydrolase [Anaerolineae bacterium]